MLRQYFSTAKWRFWLRGRWDFGNRAGWFGESPGVPVCIQTLRPDVHQTALANKL